jgi:heme/copper-type cytochrome/quinol oxidase subunit 3
MVLATQAGGGRAMMQRRYLDVSRLPAYSVDYNAPIWWGQVGVALIEGTMFCIFIATYFYVRLSMDTWPPPGDSMPRLIIPTLAWIPLLLSTGGSYWASEAAKKNDRFGMTLGLLVNFILGAVFLGMRAYSMKWFQFTWQNDAYGSVVWTILGLHTYDAIADLIFTAVLIAILLSGRIGPKQRQAVHVDSVVWYFIVLIWIPLYFVINWGQRWLGGS